MILRSRVLLVGAGIYGVLAGVFTAFAACVSGPGCEPDRLPVPAWAAEDPEGVIKVLGLAFDLSSVLGRIKLVIVVMPAVLILRSMVGGLIRGQEARRKVSIVWDIGSFWPRWFHPLAPPAYGPSAVTRLAVEIAARPPDVLAAHSQGSLIAAVALTRVDPQRRPRLFISYGSPLGILYPSLFPEAGVERQIGDTDAALAERWLNLWRRSDPIGGHPLDNLGERNWHVDTGSGHSGYELTPEYCPARERGVAGDMIRPPQSEITDCWESLGTADSPIE